jgi:hypothetical protein
VGVFDFGSRSSPVVLLLDRRDDPVTPLLVHWSYAAMIHDLIGIQDNTLQLTSAKVAEQFRWEEGGWGGGVEGGKEGGEM